MEEIYYNINQASDFLGISRQYCYKRAENEKWQVKKDEKGKQFEPLMIPTSQIRKSRQMEREKLELRLKELERLEKLHDLEDKHILDKMALET